jgi:hypothetical protein
MNVNRILSLTIVSMVLAVTANAQGSKPQPKPAQAGPATPMPGQGGKIGTPYRLGPKGKELHFTLERAEFATRFMIDSDTICANPDHRLLVLTFAVQNPAKTDTMLNEREFKMTVVSPDDENYVVENAIVQPDRRTAINMALKPAQKVRAMAYVMIHPQGPVNKLIVERGTGNPVLRYDLHDLVKPLTGPFALDKVGSINPGVGVLKVPFELGPFDFTFDSMEVVPGWGDYNPGDGKKVVVFHMVMNNVSMIKWWSTGNYSYKLFDDDGDELAPPAILKNSSDENFYTNPEPNNPTKYRVLFYVPAAAKLTKFVLTDSQSGRSVAIPLIIPGS